MKRALSVMLLALSLAQCTVGCKKTPGNANVNSRRQISGRTVTLKGQGISFIIPIGWHKDDETIETDHSQFSWRGPDNTRFAVNVSIYKPEYGNRSIEDETNSFYRDHKGDEDLRFLEIDGVKGVHFRRDWDWFDESYKPELHKLIKWNAQRMYGAKREVISLDLSCPAKSFNKDQDTLYGILQSIKFTQNDSGNSSSSLASADKVDESPVYVSVISDHEIYVRKQRVARAQLATEVDNLLWNVPDEKRIVYIKAIPDVSYGVVVSIIDDIRALGYDRIGLLADKTQQEPKTTISSSRATGPSKKDGGKSSGEQATGAREDLLVVTVETVTEGRITAQVGETRVPLRELASRVRALLKDRTDKSVKIVAPAAMRYGSIVQVIDEVKAGGADAVGLGIKSP